MEICQLLQVRKQNFFTGVNLKTMNLKRIFGATLSILGISALIYSGVLFLNTAAGTHAMKALIIYGILGLIFFISGISLIRTTTDTN
jgi:uncharacterized membrane protein